MSYLDGLDSFDPARELLPAGETAPSLQPKSLPKHRRRNGAFKRFFNVIRRLKLKTFIVSLILAAGLAALQFAGAFRIIDERFFDAATLSEAGTVPQVVIVERDPGFEGQGPRRFSRLNAMLHDLGIGKVGHLPAAGEPISPLAQNYSAAGPAPVIALPVGRVPASQNWDLVGEDANQGVPAARLLAAARYGIHRTHLAGLSGAGGMIPTFESELSGVTADDQPFLVRMPSTQNIPVVTASQILSGDLRGEELRGMVALVAPAEALAGRLTTPLSPKSAKTSEAIFRAHVLQTLLSGRATYFARDWEVLLLLFCMASIAALSYWRSDPKRIALPLSLALTAAALASSWAALQFAGKLLPLTAMAVTPWLVAFSAVLIREQNQDGVLEETAARAVQKSFRRSALREGARLPEFLGFAGQLAALDRSLLIARNEDGTFEPILEHGASLDELTENKKVLKALLNKVRGRSYAYPADDLVPGWSGESFVTWLGGSDRELFWIYTMPAANPKRKSAHLVRAIAASFRELFHWRGHLNSRSRQEVRFLPIDDKISSAIELVAREAEHVRFGFDTIETAVVIFHLIGSPLHANARMEDIYAEAGMAVSELSLFEALRALTDLDDSRINAMLEDLALNGGEMRLPMRKIGNAQRIMRVAAPKRFARGGERVIVLEAVDVSDHHRAADLRQAVALYIDLQLRNDFEAIMLGVDLAGDERIPPEKIRPIVKRIGESAKRATGRLDRVAELIHSDISDIMDACYPIDVRKTVLEAKGKVSKLANELAVNVETDVIGIGGFTIAEPKVLGQMMEAMLQVVIADTPRGETVMLKVEEEDERTHIRISGGFGIGFERLVRLLEDTEAETVGEFRTISGGIHIANKWGAAVSYWGHEAQRFGFNIDLRRIG
jgi:hypothetical protein